MSLPVKSRVFRIDDSPKFHDVGWADRKPERGVSGWILLAVLCAAFVWIWVEVLQ